MAGEMPEIWESSVALGDIVAALSKARDMAQAGERIKMGDALRRAEKFIQAFDADCRVICAEREGEKEDGQ